MRSEGFAPYCTDPAHNLVVEEPSELSKHTRAVGVTFACTCSFVTASNLMKEANAEAFKQSVGQNTVTTLQRLNTGIILSFLTHYWEVQRYRLEQSEEWEVLNLEEPGINDLLGWLLEEVRNQIRGKTISFQRSGILGFEAVAIPLVEQTTQAIYGAVQKFGW